MLGVISGFDPFTGNLRFCWLSVAHRLRNLMSGLFNHEVVIAVTRIVRHRRSQVAGRHGPDST